MSEMFGKRVDRKEVIKEVLRKLHQGASSEEIKKQFKEAIEGVTPTEIAQIEEELIKEGMSREEIQKLCDVHLAVFRESLEKERSLAPAGHPVHILMEEHKIMLEDASKLKSTVKEMEGKDFSSTRDLMEKLAHLIDHFRESESHYLREENVLFPYLEKHGITQPPAIMWSEHNRIREIKKNLYEIFDMRNSVSFQDFLKRLEEVVLSLADMLSNHFYKENKILFPTAIQVIDQNEWKSIRNQFDELGYCSFTPESAKVSIGEAVEKVPGIELEGMVPLETGSLSKEEIEAIFDALPVDITFVDKDDTVRYFSQSKERIFVRTKAVIGRKVQQCHPQKSIHVVNQILEDFRSGKKDVAEFWINFEGRFIYIRYFAVRDKSGNYLGCVEVTQDITNIKKIEGEKRLLES